MLPSAELERYDRQIIICELGEEGTAVIGLYSGDRGYKIRY